VGVEDTYPTSASSQAPLLYAMSRTSTTPSESRRMLNGSAVVVIGVDRRGVGRDDCRRWPPILHNEEGCAPNFACNVFSEVPE
jgi:hypothetical protein